MRGRVACSLAVLIAAACSKSQPATVLLSIRNGGTATVPDGVRLNVYGTRGPLFGEARLPAQGTLIPTSASVLGTIVIYLKDTDGQVRFEAHGIGGSETLSQGTARCTPEAGRQVAADLVLQPGTMPDADGDRLPDTIDNCIYVWNDQQGDSDEDGVGDVCGGSIYGGAPNGSGCKVDMGCESQHCVDGFCCDTACDQPCQSCKARPGTCTDIAEGQDSEGDCAMDPVSTCGRTGKCGAGRTCALYRDGQECAAASCGNSSQSSARTCDGAGACRDAVVIACGVYACTALQCATTCTADAQCATGYYCAAPACVRKLDVAMACTANNQCLTGFCADGVCCTAACTGTCKSCISPNPGICTAYDPGTDPEMECAQGLACNGSGACFARCTQDSPDCEAGNYCAAGGACAAKKDAGGACGTANECKSGFCTDGVCCHEACNETCRSCNLSGSVGTCGFVANGQRDTTGMNQCAPPNRCDGAGACQ